MSDPTVNNCTQDVADLPKSVTEGAFSIMFVSVCMSCFVWQIIHLGLLLRHSLKPLYILMFIQALGGCVCAFVTLLTSLIPVSCNFVSIPTQRFQRLRVVGHPFWNLFSITFILSSIQLNISLFSVIVLFYLALCLATSAPKFLNRHCESRRHCYPAGAAMEGLYLLWAVSEIAYYWLYPTIWHLNLYCSEYHSGSIQYIFLRWRVHHRVPYVLPHPALSNVCSRPLFINCILFSYLDCGIQSRAGLFIQLISLIMLSACHLQAL